MVKTVAYNQNFGICRCEQGLFEIAVLLLDLQVIARIVLHSDGNSGKFLACDVKENEQLCKTDA